MNPSDLGTLLDVATHNLTATVAWLATHPFWLLVTLMVFDIVTGLLVAFKQRGMSSKISRDGMIRKAGILLAVAFGTLIEPLSGVSLMPVGTTIIGLFCIPEALSVVENLKVLGVNVPLAERLQNARKGV